MQRTKELVQISPWNHQIRYFREEERMHLIHKQFSEPNAGLAVPRVRRRTGSFQSPTQDCPEELTVKIENVPDGYKLNAGKELKVGPASGWLPMQVEKQ